MIRRCGCEGDRGVDDIRMMLKQAGAGGEG